MSKLMVANECITIMPGQLEVREYPNSNDVYIHPSIYDIKSKSPVLYDKFIKDSYAKGLFSYSNAGTSAINSMWTFDDGQASAKWFIDLCKYCSNLKAYGIPVEFVYDTDFMLEEDVQYANADYSDTEFYGTEESEKILASYIWYFKQVVERCGINVRIQNPLNINGKSHSIDIFNDRFRIHDVRRLLK